MQTKTRLIALLLGLVLVFCLSACQKAPAETTDAPAETADFGIFPEIAGENGTTYANLFDVILSAGSDGVWTEKCAAIVGEDGAAEAASYLKSYISRDIYGQEAVDAYTSPELVGFDCWYINGAKTFTFSGDTATITLTDGSSQTHTYTYLGQYKVGDGETMVYDGQEIDPVVLRWRCIPVPPDDAPRIYLYCSSATTRWLRPIILSSATAAILTRCRNTSPARMPTGSLPASTRAPTRRPSTT